MVTLSLILYYIRSQKAQILRHSVETVLIHDIATNRGYYSQRPYLSTCIHAHRHARKHAHAHSRPQAYACARMHARATNTRTYTHTYVQTQTHIEVYTYTLALMLQLFCTFFFSYKTFIMSSKKRTPFDGLAS